MSDLIRLERVTAAYGAEPVLVDIDLAIADGDFVGIVGPSGSGKSTLLRILTGSMRPSSGSIERSPKVRIGYVPQVETVNWFFPVTVREAVLMASPSGRRGPRATPEEIRGATEILEHLGLGDLGDRHIRALSGGQQQRVFIARALMRRPNLLLLDEPTSGVDVRTRHDVMHLLHELHHEGLAIVLTTHDLNGIAAHLPSLVCVNREVIARGSPREVMTPDVLERAYGAPMDVLTHGGMPVVVERVEEAPLVEATAPLPKEHHEHPA